MVVDVPEEENEPEEGCDGEAALEAAQRTERDAWKAAATKKSKKKTKKKKESSQHADATCTKRSQPCIDTSRVQCSTPRLIRSTLHIALHLPTVFRTPPVLRWVRTMATMNNLHYTHRLTLQGPLTMSITEISPILHVTYRTLKTTIVRRVSPVFIILDYHC